MGDITDIRTDEGWLYLAVLLDLYSRRVVGWQMSARIDRQLLCDALQAAILISGKPEWVIRIGCLKFCYSTIKVNIMRIVKAVSRLYGYLRL